MEPSWSRALRRQRTGAVSASGIRCGYLFCIRSQRATACDLRLPWPRRRLAWAVVNGSSREIGQGGSGKGLCLDEACRYVQTTTLPPAEVRFHGEAKATVEHHAVFPFSIRCGSPLPATSGATQVLWAGFDDTRFHTKTRPLLTRGVASPQTNSLRTTACEIDTLLSREVQHVRRFASRGGERCRTAPPRSAPCLCQQV